MNEIPEQDEADEDIVRLLGAAGPREELPEELRSRWEAHLRAELAAVQPARRRFALPLAALAASVVLLLLVLDRFAADVPATIPISVQAVAGTAEVLLDGKRRLAAVPGQNLASGATIASGRGSRAALHWAGYDLRLNSNSRVGLFDDHLRLEQGEIYISNLGRKTLLRSAVVVTPLASIRDIGTQFRVRVGEDTVVASVRDGSILLTTPAGEHRVDAGRETPQALQLSPGKTPRSAADAADWTWIFAVAQPFELEGRTVVDFLRWSSRETGRRLEFADENAALAARNTRLSGTMDISRVDPAEAVDLVLSTTRFEAREESGVLLVSRRSE
jgi:ferric-dicitrate binding protein FerR (iron transport regulator)